MQQNLNSELLIQAIHSLILTLMSQVSNTSR